MDLPPIRIISATNKIVCVAVCVARRVRISFHARNLIFKIHIYRLCPSWHGLEITSKIDTTSPSASWWIYPWGGVN